MNLTDNGLIFFFFFFFFNDTATTEIYTSIDTLSLHDALPIRVEGWHNVFFLGGVLAAVILSGTVHLGEVTILGVAQQVQNLVRDAILLLMLAASWRTTPRRVQI